MLEKYSLSGNIPFPIGHIPQGKTRCFSTGTHSQVPRRKTRGAPGKLPRVHDPTISRVWGLPPPPGAPVPHLLHTPAVVSGWIRAQLNLGGSISTPASAPQGKGRSKRGQERRATGGSTPWPLDVLVASQIYPGARPWRGPGRLEFSWVIPRVSLAVTWGRACDKDTHVSRREGAPSAGRQIVSGEG